MARKSKGIILKPVLFIACEGTATEFGYFDRWAQTDLVRDSFERVNVYPNKDDKRPQTTPYELFLKAKENILDGSANKAWAVFDKDNHPKLTETFSEAAELNHEKEEKVICIAFSSRSFEEWILMHYEKNATTFNVSECKEDGEPIGCGTPETPDCLNAPCLSGHLRREGYVKDFEKTATFNLYNHVIEKTEIAIVNSAWLRYKTNSSLNEPLAQPLRELNPYTDVDQLILILSGREDKIEWGETGQDVILDGIVINAQRVNEQIIVRLSHNQHQAIVLLARFPMLPFYTTDDGLNDNLCQSIQREYIIQQNGSDENLLYAGDVVQYTLHANNQPYFLFKDISLTSNLRIYIEL